MSKIRNIVMAGALAFATVAPVAVEAAPMMNAPLKVEKSTDVTSVRCWRCGGWRGRGWHGGWHRGWRGGRWGWWGPRVVIGPTVVVRPYRHWAWCGPRWHRYRCVVRY
jgi:hypothetical protein